MKRTLIKLASVLAVLTLVSGCASTKKTDGEGAGVDDRGGAAAAGAGGRGAWAGNPLDNPDSPLYNKVVYFEFDSSDIRAEYIDMLRAHAQHLASNPGAKVTLEGHADERGSREYNMALGERRALVVRRFMNAEGASESQLKYLSYGEERAADPGQGEQAWSQNRRVQLVY